MPNSLSDEYRVREPPKAAALPVRFTPAHPTPATRRMPFRPENAMTTVLVLAIAFLCLVGVTGGVVIALWGHDASNTQLGIILGVVIMSLQLLLGSLKNELARKQITGKVEEVSTKVETATKEAAKKVEVATRVAAEKAELIARKVDDVHQDIKQDVGETKKNVAELAKHTNGELTSAVREAGEQARAGERDQLLPEVLNHPDFRRLLDEVANAAVKKYCGK